MKPRKTRKGGPKIWPPFLEVDCLLRFIDRRTRSIRHSCSNRACLFSPWSSSLLNCWKCQCCFRKIHYPWTHCLMNHFRTHCLMNHFRTRTVRECPIGPSDLLIGCPILMIQILILIQILIDRRSIRFPNPLGIREPLRRSAEMILRLKEASGILSSCLKTLLLCTR